MLGGLSPNIRALDGDLTNALKTPLRATCTVAQDGHAKGSSSVLGAPQGCAFRALAGAFDDPPACPYWAPHMNRRTSRHTQSCVYHSFSFSFPKLNNHTTVVRYRTVHKRLTHSFGVTSGRSLPAQTLCLDHVAFTRIVACTACSDPYPPPARPNTRNGLRSR